jgi:phosphate transport system substrate-binding protein
MRKRIIETQIAGALAVACIAAAALVAGGCKPKQPAGPAAGEQGSGQEVKSLDGAGASFPYPIYSQWAFDYEKTKGLKLNYQSIGSGGGIAQIKARTVDFGASDAPLEKRELDEAGLVQFPMIMGGVVPVTNIEGVGPGDLKLTGTLLADIYLGKVKKWTDPAIREHNPDLALPEADITVVHRADGSGTTWIFTNYLAKVSAEWKEKVGTDKAVEWPAGVGGKGNEGVAQYVQKINGTIGYVEYAYALESSIPHAQLMNGAGTFVSPTIESFQAAAANADWKGAPGFYMVLTDQPGEGSWPITGASFILIYGNQSDAAKARAMLDFFDWCFENGGPSAEKLHYVPMPAGVVELVESEWRASVRAGGRPVWE